jgi:diphthamide biosynthesis protein 4
MTSTTDPAPNDSNDYYSLLGITRSASHDTIKAAYRSALLRLHPDKRKLDDPVPPANIGLLQDAFLTLSSTTLRTAYDEHLERNRASPRSARVVSLEEFDCSEGSSDDAMLSVWSLACRCGGKFKITESDLECGRHLVECGGCSDVVWVGYEIVKEVERD